MANPKVWIFQRKQQVERLGPDNAPWCIGWYTQEGKRRMETGGPGRKGRQDAEKRREEIKAQLIEGTYIDRSKGRDLWSAFRQAYEEKILPNLAARRGWHR